MKPYQHTSGQNPTPQQLLDSHLVLNILFIYFFLKFFLSFCLFAVVVVVVAISWAAPAAYGGSQARG